MKKTYILIGFLVLTLSSIVGFGTYFISSSYMALDQQAVNEARAMLVKQLTYYPIEGVDFNILSMVESTLPNNTDVSILSSNSSQISNDGTITYENEPTTATVTVKIRKRRSSVTEQITIIIPAITETDDTDNSIDSDTDADDGSATTDTSTGDTTTVDNTTINDIMPTGALNVTSYGANGSDQTDDTAAINSAITAAYNKGGGVVWVP
ncbi:MAG: glycosyl hydrolase family 28-related protein, partial [Candidatus Saccharimonadaceae bacterium]|nr:glycosyl hydrolase family 28-related protein [Candidatus Saccharimonadaceae bacterium]